MKKLFLLPLLLFSLIVSGQSDKPIGSTTLRTTMPSGANYVIENAGSFERLSGPAIVSGSTTPTTYVTQSANYTLTDYTATDGVCQNYVITGDASHTISVPSGNSSDGVSKWQNGSGNSFDNTKKNVVYTCALDGHITYNIQKYPIGSSGDVTPPSISSAATNGAGTQITLTYSETLGSVTPATTDFSLNLSKTATAVSVSGSTIVITVNVAYTTGDVITISYTPGTNKIQDLAGNFAVALTNYSVTNNFSSFSNTKSISLAATNQIPKSSTNPTALARGNGGTDQAFSISLWFKASSGGSNEVLASMAYNNSNNFVWQVLLNSGNLYMLIYDASFNYIGRYMTGTVTTNAWHNLVITYDGSKTAAGIAMKVDNAAPSTATNGAGSYAGMPTLTTNNQFMIGGSNNSADLMSSSKIDHVYFYNAVLTTGQITSHNTVQNPANISSYSSMIEGWELENNLSGIKSVANLTSTSAPTYSTDIP